MAGLLMVRPGAGWTVGGGLFDWTLEFLIERLTDPEAVTLLREIVDADLGSFWLSELSPEARGEVLALLRDQLVEAGEKELPAGDRKPDVIRRLRELADMARERG